MGEIINTKKRGNKLIFEVSVDYTEALQLKGHLNNVHLFSEHSTDKETHISQRGKNCATKYFLIPRELRKGFKLREKVSCQRIDTDSSTFFIYVVPQTLTNQVKMKS